MAFASSVRVPAQGLLVSCRDCSFTWGDDGSLGDRTGLLAAALALGAFLELLRVLQTDADPLLIHRLTLAPLHPMPFASSVRVPAQDLFVSSRDRGFASGRCGSRGDWTGDLA